MTKKHFIAFAAEINFMLKTDRVTVAEARKMAQVVIDVARATGATQIDADRFLTACGF